MRIFFLLLLKLLGKRPPSPPPKKKKISEANSMIRFQSDYQMNHKKGHSLHTCVQNSVPPANKRYGNSKIFLQGHEHVDDILTGDEILPSQVSKVMLIAQTG